MKKISTLRELMFQVSEIDENTNAFTIAKNLMNALKNDEINPSQYEILIYEFERNCKKYNLKCNLVTLNEFYSIF